MTDRPTPPYPEQQQAIPGRTDAMNPRPDHGETSYTGSGKLKDKATIVTGGDSGIGRAVALAFAREGADVVISYLNEDDDAAETKRLVEDAGRRAVLIAGDISEPAHARAVVDKAVEAFGRVDVLVNNAAHQQTFAELEDIPDEEWATVEERARAFWDEIAAESEVKARVVEICKRYNDVMAKAGRPYRYS